MYKNEINKIEFPITPTLNYCDLRKNPMNEENNEIKYDDIPGIEILLIPLHVKYQGFEDFYSISEGQSIALVKNEQNNNN